MQHLLSVIWVSDVFYRLTLKEGGESDFLGLFKQVNFKMVFIGKKCHRKMTLGNFLTLFSGPDKTFKPDTEQSQ